MSERTQRRAPVRANEPKGHERSRLRVLVASLLPLAAADLEALLRAHPDMEVVVSSSDVTHLESAIRDIDPDVLILDVDESENSQSLDSVSRICGVVPIIALIHDPSASWLARAVLAGIRGFLPHGVSGDELESAVRALAAGLVVLSPEFSEVMLARTIQIDSDEPELLVEDLTPREVEVLEVVAEGLPNREIADRLQISEHTVKFHISSIMGKLGASSRTEAVTLGLRRGLVFL
jgi:two-component system, NarL family, response regulator YdfI